MRVPSWRREIGRRYHSLEPRNRDHFVAGLDRGTRGIVRREEPLRSLTPQPFDLIAGRGAGVDLDQDDAVFQSASPAGRD